jgi:membrane peptidoglycan carboxypeptidase
MAAAFGTLANDGKRCNAWAVRRVEFANVPKDAPKDERVLYQHEPECEQVIEPEIAHLVTAMLQRVVCCGTGTAASLGRPVAGKTGTAQDYTNVYFAGYTPQVSTAVWVGFPDGQIPMDTYYGGSVFGGTVAAPIWHDFMVRAMAGFPVEGFEAPPPPESGTVPGVVGLTAEEAENKLANANFTPIRDDVHSFEPAGTVLAQTPGGGARLQLGSAVTLRVSDGKSEPVVIPRLTGLTQAEAVHRLERLELVAAIHRVPVDDRHLDGIVVDQSPIGDGSKVVNVGSTVTIDVGAFDQGNGNGDGTGEGDHGNGNGNGGGDEGGGEASPASPS